MKLQESDKLKLEILNNSLFFEFMVSYSLCELLDIDYDTSNSFGNKSNSLSLFAKVGLLLDMKTIDKDDSKKLISYMEIRNKFMHDYKCRSFVDCFNVIKSTGKYLLKLYQTDSRRTFEERYRECYDRLTDDTVKIVTDKMINSAVERNSEKNITKWRLERYKSENDRLLEKATNAVVELRDNLHLNNLGLTKEKLLEIQKEMIDKILTRKE